MLGDSGDVLQQKVMSGQLSHRILTALMWGATRRNHRRDLPDLASIHDLLDDIEDEYEDAEGGEMMDKVIIPLMSAYLRQSPERMKKMMRGESPEEDSEENPTERANPERDTERDQDKPTRKPKPKAVKGDRTGTGPREEGAA